MTVTYRLQRDDASPIQRFNESPGTRLVTVARPGFRSAAGVLYCEYGICLR